MRVLVTGARTYFSLPVIRQLGRAGHDVTAADCRPKSIGFYSRHASRRWVHPSVAGRPEAFAEALRSFLRREPHDLVLPLYEETILLSRLAPELRDLARIPLADYRTVLRLHDKASLYRLAASWGVPVPKTLLVRSLDEWPRVAREFEFPVVMKVGQSSSARGVAKVARPADLVPTWERLRRAHALPASVAAIVQEFVPGEQVCTLGYAYRGRVKGALVYRNVCEYPRDGGAGIVRVSVAMPEVEALARTLLERFRWHGVAGFDFLLDERTGRPLLIDANPRFTPATLLAARCGLDLVGMHLAAAEGREPAAAPPLRTGLRTRVDPLAAVWALRALFPQRDYLPRLKIAAAMLRRNPASRSDVFDADDLRSLRGLAATLVDYAKTAVLLRGRGIDYIQDSQYRDYAFADDLRSAEPPKP